MLEASRTHKFIIIAAAIMFFALADPAMVKLLPHILKSQMEMIDLSKFKADQFTAMANYTKDLFQISTFIIVLAISGIISGEKNNKTLTIPVSMGCNVFGIVGGKFILYGIFLSIASMAGMLTAYYYSGIIFGNSFDIFPALKAGALFGLYFIFVLSVVNLYSSLFQKAFMAGIMSLVTIYLMRAAEGLFNFRRFFPTHILEDASIFKPSFQAGTAISILVTLIAVLILNLLAAFKLKKTELI
jgi:ABC-2 type transport system permease protein